ncbi:alpha-L-rhamnosidase [Paraflavitalea sp. CAU 1676]|uniref:alpha-L-rhamnosidase n=1 Tax=Paraflavitalea sp. CAU 1676 TaxID=3032598 RepID=UPI0023D9F6DF|nr:alpha-L-rhamnosidase [Paraflavitalea sp. CAU 1676]MDF2190352.1 family 78 glycoside hydrolase catalytic domain [Paraflavitalea sp. CAU 1676]
MKRLLLLSAAMEISMSMAVAQVQVQQLTTENLTNPIGLDNTQPRFSWQLQSNKRNVLQTAYEIKVGTDAKIKGNGIWTSGKVSSDQSLLIPYNGSSLTSGKRYYWQVRVWDNQGNTSPWSTPAYWQTALLQPTDWKASWITQGFDDNGPRVSPLFRKEFTSGKKVSRATAYITAHGMYEAQINGKRVGDAYLTPGWTSYNKRLQYQVYDVTGLVQQGNNAIGVTLGNGWYRSYLAWSNSKDHYGTDVALLLQLDITYTDGTTQSVVSDESWKSSTGSIRYSEVYHGETVDARLDKKGWSTAGFNDRDWIPARKENYTKSTLLATYNEPVKKHETFKPLRVFKTPQGEQVLDYGQNLVGWVVVKASGKSGDSITLSHAEVMEKNGNFYTENLRAAKAENTYVLKGEGEETFEPHFTWQGFRYVRVKGYPGTINPDNFTAVALYSDMKPTGTFTSSNPLLNQLQHNIEWGLKGNFLDVPTDCPQRDERLGWTGDAQVFFRTASFLRGVGNFFDKWMKDVAADQLPTGAVPHVIPNVLGKQGGSAGWSDVATIIPWEMYLAYGDKKILEQQYPSMKAWVGYMSSQSTEQLWNKGGHFGDWLFYSVNDDRDGHSAITNKYLIAQCFYAYSTQLLINAATVLGNTQDVATYTTQLNNIKEAFRKEYTTPNGATTSNTQTSYVLALQFDMLPEAQRQQAADRLVKNIKQYGNHLTTGFLGTPYLCHVLSRFGYTDIAYSLLLQETYPSWLYPVKMGATTIWERWDGMKPDSTFQTPSMNSFNHYAYGAIGDWMYRVMVGIDTDDDGVGYKKITIKPHIGQKITNAGAAYDTRYGKLSSAWKVENGKLLLDVEIPANTTATIYIPANNAGDILESDRPLVSGNELQVAGTEPGYVKLKAGSGIYRFSTKWDSKK